MLAGKGFGKTRKFCPPCAALGQRQSTAQRTGFSTSFGNYGAGWFVEVLGDGEWFG